MTMKKNYPAKSVDIIIPTYKPGPEFGELLRRLGRQNYPIHEILIINTEESYWNRDWECVPQLHVHHITRQEFDHAAARKIAAEMSDADVMVFMTMDALPTDRRLITNLVEALYSVPDAAVVYARQLPKADCSYLEKYTRSFNYGPDSRCKRKADLQELGIKTFFCSDVCAAYRKDIYKVLGGFTEHALFNEDMLFAAAAIEQDYAVIYSAESRVYHSHNYTSVQQFHRNFDLGVSQAQHSEVFENYPSEGEGISLVLNTMKHLIRNGRIYLVPKLIMDSGMKYLGYRLGKSYKNLPPKLVIRFTTMPTYWENNTF